MEPSAHPNGPVVDRERGHICVRLSSWNLGVFVPVARLHGDLAPLTLFPHPEDRDKIDSSLGHQGCCELQ